MAIGRATIAVGHRTHEYYQQDDISRGLRASLVAVLAATLTSSETNFDYLRGVFSLARSQAALYGIAWSDVICSLQNAPELWCLVGKLQTGALSCLEQRISE
jgi:hypothetical protein